MPDVQTLSSFTLPDDTTYSLEDTVARETANEALQKASGGSSEQSHTVTFGANTVNVQNVDGTSILTTFNDDGSIVEQKKDSKGAVTSTVTTVFNADGSISVTVSQEGVDYYVVG